jgi:hypothetical protein
MISHPGLLNLHFGVPYFFGDQLIRTLRTSQEKYPEDDVFVPDPDSYRQVLGRKAAGELGGTLLPMEEEHLVKALKPEVKNLILSFNALFGGPATLIKQGALYPMAVERLSSALKLFPNKDPRLTLTVANPGVMISSLISEGHIKTSSPEQAACMRPLWYDLVESLSEAFPDMPITIAPMEDSHVTWPILLHKIQDLPEDRGAAGSLAMAMNILTPHGREVLTESVNATPLTQIGQLIALIEMAVNTYCDPKCLEKEIDLPGWTQEVIDDFDVLYEQDIDCCADLDNVTVLDWEAALSTASV